MFYKETEYALRGLVYIQLKNQQHHRPGITEIARETGAPAPYIAKILQRLVKAGMLISRKGKKGGFYFDPYQPELPLLEVVRTIEGDHVFNGCGLGLKLCSEEKPCPLHFKFAPIRLALHELLYNETIQSMARKILPDEEIHLGPLIKNSVTRS